MPMTRLLWLSLGFVALVLAVLGIALPLLPTTPFLLVAAFAFARSSERLHTWLVTHPRFGPSIGHWRREGAISRNAKVVSVAVMVAALTLSWLADVAPIILAAQATVLAMAAAFVISRPDPSQ